MEKNDNSTNLIRQVLNSEVKWVVGIIIFVAGVVAPYYGIVKDISLIQKDIEVINANHMTHLEDLAEVTKDNQLAIIELQKQLILVTNQIK